MVQYAKAARGGMSQMLQPTVVTEIIPESPFAGVRGTVRRRVGGGAKVYPAMIDYLEERGYVARQSHPSDGLGKIVLLTERGWAYIRATEAVFTDIERQWTDLVGAERMALVRSDLRRFVYALGNGELPIRLRPV